jgi:hypothetical protein
MTHILRRTVLAATAAGAGAMAWTAGRPRMLTWGATGEEVVRPLAGDDLVANPLYVTTRAITVQAPAAAVWPWLVQLGQNRGGFYTYDFIENVFGLNIHSATHIHPEWQNLKIGEDYVALDPSGALKMTIVIMEPERALVVRAGAPGAEPQPPGDFFKGEIACTWGFFLEPTDELTTRLVARMRAAWADSTAAKIARPVLFEPVHFVMEQRMLRGVRDRAEAAQTAGLSM